MTIILDGKELSKKIKNTLKDKLLKYNNKPGLAIILVGNRSDSEIYVRMKKKACKYVGINNYDFYFDENVCNEVILDKIKELNYDYKINGILVQLPLPKHLDKDKILNSIKIEKDIDGFHENNVGKLTLNKKSICPCTPMGVIRLLEEYNINLIGKNIVVIGKSNIVGLPLSLLLLHKEATVTICHSKTKNLNLITKNADILISACGQPEMINSNYIKEGVIIIDIGINRIEYNNEKGYKIVGDVNYDDVINKCYAITPVPGGIGPMTIAILLENCFNNFLTNTNNEEITYPYDSIVYEEV